MDSNECKALPVLPHGHLQGTSKARHVLQNSTRVLIAFEQASNAWALKDVLLVFSRLQHGPHWSYISHAYHMVYQYSCHGPCRTTDNNNNICYTCPGFCPSFGWMQHLMQYPRQAWPRACVANIVIHAGSINSKFQLAGIALMESFLSSCLMCGLRIYLKAEHHSKCSCLPDNKLCCDVTSCEGNRGHRTMDVVTSCEGNRGHHTMDVATSCEGNKGHTRTSNNGKVPTPIGGMMMGRLSISGRHDTSRRAQYRW